MSGKATTKHRETSYNCGCVNKDAFQIKIAIKFMYCVVKDRQGLLVLLMHVDIDGHINRLYHRQ